MSNISEIFARRKGFVAFIAYGYPSIEASEKLIEVMARNGVDLIEIGIPFSDPTAEGAVIANANEIALKNGINTDTIFESLRRVRERVSANLSFMTYANVVFSYGKERFIAQMRDLGMCALILPDVPFEERGEFEGECRANGVDLISFIAPTSVDSADRMARIVREARGFIYCVSSLGVTGIRANVGGGVREMVAQIKQIRSDIPVAVGFGISNAQKAREIAEFADAIIIGSAIVKLCESEKDCVQKVGAFVKEVRGALDSAKC
ncbi:tryptophan synthase subunit alpha [Helicobacter sp. 23-1045]